MKARLPYTRTRKEIQDEAHYQARLAYAELAQKHADEIIATILLTLHNDFGFGEVRLKRFWQLYESRVKSLIERYELRTNAEDAIFICTEKLKAQGIDWQKWESESEDLHL